MVPEINLGFMQGRLSPIVDGRIQSFPVDSWRQEFDIGKRLGFRFMEWTLDADGLRENPLMSPQGRVTIQNISRRTGISVRSVTGDCFMQKPFWKARTREVRASLLSDVRQVLEACISLRASILVIPLVDNGSLRCPEDEVVLLQGLLPFASWLTAAGLTIAFESDYPPDRLAALVDKFPPTAFGINYDSGNSAALGFPAEEEFRAYGRRVVNVHIKDRTFRGGSVPLGCGDANLPLLGTLLRTSSYDGLCILQTARAVDGDHESALVANAKTFRRACGVAE